MKCDEFYKQTQSILNAGKIEHNANKSAAHVYYGTALPVVFYDVWNANDISTLHQLEDIKEWENSSSYVEVHSIILKDGTDAISLSATTDVSHANDVTEVTLTADQIYIAGVTP